MDKDFRNGTSDGLVLSTSAFYKHLYNQVIASTTLGENYTNQGSGRIYGLENQLKLEPNASDPYSYSGWVSYTLSKSERWNKADPTPRPSQYDQTHIFTILGAKGLGSNWKISSRFRYVTGQPSTPVLGSVFDSDNDVYIPLRGSVYSSRLPAFYQLDLRFDKKWIYNTWILSLYLDIQNLLNRKNVEDVQYSYNYQQSAYVTGLPVIPTFGVRAEF